MREKQSYKTKYRGKPSIFHPKKQKIEGIFHGCLRFFGSNGTNGSAPFFVLNATLLMRNEFYFY